MRVLKVKTKGEVTYRGHERVKEYSLWTRGRNTGERRIIDELVDSNNS